MIKTDQFSVLLLDTFAHTFIAQQITIASLNNNCQIDMTNIVDLPPEIQLQIIKHLFYTGSHIVPLITSCKPLYTRFRYLIYRLHLFDYAIDRNSFTNKSTQNDQVPLTYTASRNITLMRLRVNNIFKPYHSRYYHTRFVLQFRHLDVLAVLTLSTDSFYVLFDLMKCLPSSLRYLSIHYTGTPHPFPMTSRYETFYAPVLLTRPRALRCLEVSSKYPIQSEKLIHACVVNYWLYQAMEENIWNSTVSSMGKAWHIITSNYPGMRRRSILLRFGQLLYALLKEFRGTLEDIRFNNIDVGMVYNLKYDMIPLKMTLLKMLTFDNLSSNSATLWMHPFQMLNHKNAQFDGLHIPLIINNDRIGNVLYYKCVNETFVYEPGGPSLMSGWHKAAPELMGDLRSRVGLSK